MAVDGVATVVADQTTAPPSEEAKAWAELMEENAAAELEDGDAAPIVQEPKEGSEPEVKEPDITGKVPTLEELRAENDNKTKALRAERAEKQMLAQRLANYDEFIKTFRESRQQKLEPERKETQEQEIPDINEDPVGHFQAQVVALQKQVQQLSQGTQQTQQQLQHQTAETQFWGAVERSEIELRTTSPRFTIQVDGKAQEVSDYDLACQHLETKRVAELKRMLPDDSPQAIEYAQRLGAPSVAAVRQYMLNQDRIAVARHAMTIGTSPAQLYYDLALERGYTPPTQLQPQNKGKQQITAAQRGQKAAATISGGSGGTKRDIGNLSDLADLALEDPEAFDVAWEKAAAAGMLG
jgi:hypothetical protein